MPPHWHHYHHCATIINVPRCTGLEMAAGAAPPETALDCASGCAPHYVPVCAADGHTYANLCLAACQGLAVTSMAECEGAGPHSHAGGHR
jgi:hypothetical protein